MRICKHILCVLASVSAIVEQVSAASFLAQLQRKVFRNVSDPAFKTALLAEIESVLGQDSNENTRERMNLFENVLRPMYSALPKNTFGKLDPSGVQYILRRLFLRKNGWSVSGLEVAGDAWDSQAHLPIFGDRAPEMVKELFKKHIGKHGSGLHDVALLAIMMEQLIFEDILGKLHQAYVARRFDPEKPISRVEALNMISLYVASFIRSQDVAEWSTEQVVKFEQQMFQLYPAWKSTRKKIVQIAKTVAPGLKQFGFDDVASVAAEFSVRFAQWLHEECSATKRLLIEMEDADSGRVRLVDFYKAALEDGRYQFTESITFLRQLGSLDESDEVNPKVIIPNYVAGQSNCVARSTYYSVCCPDECEGLFAHIEKHLGKPTATVSEIAYAVLSTTTFPKSGGRISQGLPPLLHRRLNEVATHHGGVVPLHGRLFSQWMHLTYPRECAYPHKAGSVYFKPIEAWENDTGERSGVTMDELEHWTRHLSDRSGASSTQHQADNADHDHDHLSGMWTMEEELVVATRQNAPASGTVSALLGVSGLRGGEILGFVVIACASRIWWTNSAKRQCAYERFRHKVV